MKNRSIPTWTPLLLSLAASIAFAIVLVVGTANFRHTAARIGDDAELLDHAFDLCECAAGLLGACAVASIMFIARRLKRRLEQVAEENRHMRQMEKFRRDFVSDVTHEIRTPLTGIMGAVEMLRDHADGLSAKERADLMDVIGTQSGRLNRLALDILSLSRIESRKDSGKLDFAPGNLDAMMENVHAAFLPSAKLKNIELRLVRNDSTVLSCDIALIEQAVANLVENALRYSNSKSIEMSLSSMPSKAIIAVTDHGVGIPPEHRKRIFERFYQVDRSRAKGGTGLGLAIVKHIANLHNGEAAIADTPGGGATFTLTLPSDVNERP